jgi:hypothetical protein
MEKTTNLQIFSLRLDDRTIALIRSKPRRFRSAWVRQVIATAVQNDAA